MQSGVVAISSKTDKSLNDRAASQTVALNPLVGMSSEEVLDAARKTAGQAIRKPLSLLRAGASYSKKLTAVALGDREYKPAAKDRRFSDSAWSNSALHRGLLQSYLAFVETLDEWVDDAGFDDMGARRAKFITKIVSDSVSPTNALLSNPAALKQVVDTGGGSIVNGVRNFLHDRRHNNGMPAQVDKSKFKVGENIATTRGAVVFRNSMLELIQYAPVTEKVYRRPILFIPPQVNKYYVYDLSPEKSFFQYCVAEGLQTFTISWKNPTSDNADWGIDHYVTAVKEALDVVQRISGSKTVNLCAPCSGGITAMIFAAHLKEIGNNAINAMTLPVCVLQQDEKDSDLSLFVNNGSIQAARARSRRQGVLRGKDLSKVFSWMRPNDLIFGYVVNNYLMGNNPPVFDILFWNNDSTNLPAQLHSDFLDIIGSGAMSRPGDISVCDTDIDIKSLNHDIYLIGGLTDHITPWQACYRTVRLAGGKKEFVLVGSGHIQSLVTPPDNPKAKYFTNTETPDRPEAWIEDAKENQGTWWPHWSAWMRKRSGSQRKAPASLGSKIHEPLCDAPGEYVLEQAG